MKIELNKDNRIKRSENHEIISEINNRISIKIQEEFQLEISSYRAENENLFKEEKDFFKQVQELLKTVTPSTKLKVCTQVGKGSTVLHTYTGHIEKGVGFNPSYFNFISEERDNDLKPFTIGFSCLQSIEVIN